MSTSLDLHHVQRLHGGIIYDGGRRWLGPGPGHSRQDRSLAVMVSPDGRLIFHSFAGDATRDCFDHLGIERDEAARAKPSDFREMMKPREREQQAERRRKIAFCEGVWSETLPAEGSPVGVYLRSHRGLPISTVPTSLRFHPSAPTCYPWSERQAPRTPAMIALVTDAHGNGIGLHVTPITTVGRRSGRGKIMLGAPCGGCVRLAPLEEGGNGLLAVAEGIETALGFQLLHRVPTWASLSTSGMMAAALPRAFRGLLVAADGDDAGAGMKAAERLADRWTRKVPVEIRPAPTGKDWADVARETFNG